jgi:hypothetical protein
MGEIPERGSPAWALSPAPEDLANRILRAVAAEAEAAEGTPLWHLAAITIALVGAGAVLTLVTGLWAPVLAVVQQVGGWVAAASAMAGAVAAWPVAVAAIVWVGCELLLLSHPWAG